MGMMRIVIGIVLFVAVCVTGAAGAEAPQTQMADYEKWGFRIGLPPDADKIEFQADDSVLLSEVYVKDGLAYHIKILAVTSDLLTPTEIEKAIQVAVANGKDNEEVIRWELETRDKRLFKGYNHEVSFDQETLGRMPYIQNILPQGTGVESVALAQVKDDTSPILSVSVIGPKEKAADVSTRAKFTAYTVETLKKKETGEIQIPKPGKQVEKNTKLTPARPKLGKGDIELTGMVESIGKDGKSLVLLVNRIRLPDKDQQNLDPARPKNVVFDKMPEDIRVGFRLLVIGKNEGVGKPIEPSFSEILKPAKELNGPMPVRVP